MAAATATAAAECARGFTALVTDKRRTEGRARTEYKPIPCKILENMLITQMHGRITWTFAKLPRELVERFPGLFLNKYYFFQNN